MNFLLKQNFVLKQLYEIGPWSLREPANAWTVYRFTPEKKCNFDPDWDFQPWSLTGLISTTLEHATRIGSGLKILQCETGWTKSPVWNRFRPRYFGQCEQAVVEFKIQTLIKNTTKLPHLWSLLLSIKENCLFLIRIALVAKFKLLNCTSF